MPKPLDRQEIQVKEFIKRTRRERDVQYWELAEKLKDYNEEIKEQALINKLNRGRYSLTFALKVLAAMGVESLDVHEALGVEKSDKTKK